MSHIQLLIRVYHKVHTPHVRGMHDMEDSHQIIKPFGCPLMLQVMGDRHRS